jgi:hypothetical protein
MKSFRSFDEFLNNKSPRKAHQKCCELIEKLLLDLSFGKGKMMEEKCDGIIHLHESQPESSSDGEMKAFVT